ncbi:MAG: bifunctional phosphoribosyl-AMP cyclohydrolase/phosphoribosyl-ATP diphosphatase HisIE [Cyclobacteriaceae bacterium]|nr:bifunctional phosphoribosyl-AMP cyclohydrolase/phosphoribosyl-ATP diphosphatase HisIE [Cyclobacteriaceae bacterium]MCH8516002.1 bifunctional phosphoribosyl-AMP cyclohydrolase/phosphoribosyl-ATP diphosphatase HisIE [Cyclobacteriaceae bacterium]
MRKLQDIASVDFSKSSDGLVPCVVQDDATRRVLMLGYMNEAALKTTIETKKATFFSRSKNRLWTKGESSGNFLHLKQLLIDCDADTILLLCQPEGPACHTGDDTCFQQNNNEKLYFADQLESIIRERLANPQEKSYTSSLVQRGINKVAQKVGEEAVELVIEAMDNSEDLFKNEAADLFYHYLILLQAKGFEFKDILTVLEERNRKKS